MSTQLFCSEFNPLFDIGSFLNHNFFVLDYPIVFWSPKHILMHEFLSLYQLDCSPFLTIYV